MVVTEEHFTLAGVNDSEEPIKKLSGTDTPITKGENNATFHFCFYKGINVLFKELSFSCDTETDSMFL